MKVVKVPGSTTSEGHCERRKIKVIEIEEFEGLSVFTKPLSERVETEHECTCPSNWALYSNMKASSF